jgi:hypothetical protein
MVGISDIHASDGDCDMSSVLGKKSRRVILSILAEADTSLEIADLATELACLESTDEESESLFELAQQILIELHHCDLPKLADVGLVDYDAENRLVSVSEKSGANSTTLARSGSSTARPASPTWTSLGQEL